MTNLVIKNGKFYRDNQLIPTEIGNLEQIECLKEYQREQQELQQLKEEGIVLDVDYETTVTAYCKQKCECGKYLFFECEVKEEGDIDEFIGIKFSVNEWTHDYFIGQNKGGCNNIVSCVFIDNNYCFDIKDVKKWCEEAIYDYHRKKKLDIDRGNEAKDIIHKKII